MLTNPIGPIRPAIFLVAAALPLASPLVPFYIIRRPGPPALRRHSDVRRPARASRPQSDLPPPENGKEPEPDALWDGTTDGKPLGSTTDLLRVLSNMKVSTGDELSLPPPLETKEDIDAALGAVATYAKRYKMPRTEGEERKRAKARAAKSPLGRRFLDIGEPEMYDNFGGDEFDAGGWLRRAPRPLVGAEEEDEVRRQDQDRLGDVREGIPLQLWRELHFNKRALLARKRWEQPGFKEKTMTARKKTTAAAKAAKEAAEAAATAAATANAEAGNGGDPAGMSTVPPPPPAPRRKPRARARGESPTGVPKKAPQPLDEAAVDEILRTANVTATDAVRAVEMARGAGEKRRRAQLKKRYEDPQAWMEERLEKGDKKRQKIWGDEEREALHLRRAEAAKKRWRRVRGEELDGSGTSLVDKGEGGIGGAESLK